MKIAGKSNTKSSQTLQITPPPQQKNSNELWEFVKECGEHIKKNRVRWFFALVMLVVCGFVKSAYNKVTHLEKKYYELDKQLAIAGTKNEEVNRLENKIDLNSKISECKNGALLECYNKCNLQEILKRQNACEATK